MLTTLLLHRSAKWALCLLLPLGLLAVGACEQQSSLKTVAEEGSLRIITRNGPSTYYEDRNGPTGFEYELAKRFADYLGGELQVESVHSLEDIFKAIDNNSVHLAAAGLTITPERQKRFNFSPAYSEVRQYVLYRADRSKPKSIEDIINSRITVMADSSHEEILSNLSHEYPELQWRAATDVETIDILDMLAEGEIDYSIIDSNDFTANKGFYPRLKIAFEIGKPGYLAWALANNPKDQELQEQLKRFFKEIREDGSLRQLEERFYSHSQEVNQIGSQTFSRAVKKKLPKYQPLIQQVAEEYELDWRLLAAISYQESHWNPKARSPTGVRGMMMLTLPTAKEMGIVNRLDAEQSLRGGARYFNKIWRRIPEQVAEPDRTWLALAAYNVGLGHVKDAQIITSQQELNPHKWADVKDHLPLLRKKRWYKNTRHGYARGNEPVTYVQNIRHYYNLLTWSDLARDRTPPPQQVDQYLPELLKNDFKSL